MILIRPVTQDRLTVHFHCVPFGSVHQVGRSTGSNSIATECVSPTAGLLRGLIKSSKHVVIDAGHGIVAISSLTRCAPASSDSEARAVRTATRSSSGGSVIGSRVAPAPRAVKPKPKPFTVYLKVCGLTAEQMVFAVALRADPDPVPRG